jgi:hypothetical protein
MVSDAPTPLEFFPVGGKPALTESKSHDGPYRLPAVHQIEGTVDVL